MTALPPASRSGSALPTEPADRLVGQVAYVFTYDVAYDTTRASLSTLLGQPIKQFLIGPSHRSPRQVLFYSPQMVDLPPRMMQGPNGPVSVNWRVKVFSVGALSIQVLVPFDVASLQNLVSYHDPVLDGRPLDEQVRELVERALTELGGYFLRPVGRLRDEEAYTVFCLQPPVGHFDGERWLHEHRRQVAGLLTQEARAEALSDQEAAESTQLYLSYYTRDLVLVDWDAALVVDEADNFEPLLHVMEFANVQLTELEAYDRILDESLERSYRDLLGRSRRGQTEVMRSLRELRIDMSRFSDELGNITKFIGDYHLARLYGHLLARFHLSDWHRSVDNKLRTLDGLYQLLKQDQTNRWMMVLEATIVALFVIDLVILLALG